MCVLNFFPKGQKSMKIYRKALIAIVSVAVTLSSGLSELGIDPASVGVLPDVKHDAQNEPGFQLELPKEGDAVAVLQTSQGDIVLRLFPEQAPKTVTNFINLAKAGSYDKTSFHKVICLLIILWFQQVQEYPEYISCKLPAS